MEIQNRTNAKKNRGLEPLPRLRFPGEGDVVALQRNKIPLEYFDPINHVIHLEEGRVRIVESKPKGLKPKFFVTKYFNPPSEQQAGLAVSPVDVVGEARLQLALIKALKGTPVTAAKPLAIYYPRNDPDKTERILISEFVPGTVPQPVDRNSKVLHDEHGFRAGYAGLGQPMELIHQLLRSRGFLPIDLHEKNVIFNGKKWVIVDAKHIAPHPLKRPKSSRKLFPLRWVNLKPGQMTLSEALSFKKRLEVMKKTLHAEVIPEIKSYLQNSDVSDSNSSSKQYLYSLAYEFDENPNEKTLQNLLSEWKKIGNSSYYLLYRKKTPKTKEIEEKLMKISPLFSKIPPLEKYREYFPKKSQKQIK